jgi:hypothetical protein
LGDWRLGFHLKVEICVAKNFISAGGRGGVVGKSYNGYEYAAAETPESMFFEHATTGTHIRE